ncbi:diguanylate cyclase [Microaerobacter geothermalis]|uniref:diguanylate cyclase domain-containing protein n=1 Tax=Microaerobacter geothermalis TaxID=674972 RepID=UPI001F31DDCA|nr:diguanylate cyclase [Microaerobacter geothermalis]MCF6094924.1 diguanylate cyclase [Microaerobacter geothermalis]
MKKLKIQIFQQCMLEFAEYLDDVEAVVQFIGSDGEILDQFIHGNCPWFGNPQLNPSISKTEILLEEKDQFYGTIVLYIREELKPRFSAFLEGLARMFAILYMEKKEFESMKIEAKRREMLFQVTQKIHASIDVDEVLLEIINNIRTVYPQFEVDLWLSQDISSSLPVKTFTVNYGESDITGRAYMEGRVICTTDPEEDFCDHGTSLAAPLRGKQGVYGILFMNSDETVYFDKEEINFLALLADVAGSAFENAQLYQQSRHLNRDLQLINNMAQRLNQSLNLTELLQFISDQLLETFRADYTCVMLLDGENLHVRSSSDPSSVGKNLPVSLQVFQRVIKQNDSIILTDVSKDYMEDFKRIADILELHFRSLLAVPIVSDGKRMGAILVLSSRASAFTFDDFKLLQTISQHTALALTNALLHTEVERMVITDHLTGLHARSYLDEQIQLSLMKDPDGTLIMIDIDHFKKVNDTYGHQVGDQVLIQVAEVLQANIRQSDIAARWGGEELAVYLPKVPLEVATTIAERIRLKVMESTDPQVTISSGVAYWSKEAPPTVEVLVNVADRALYEAKRMGRNRVIIANEAAIAMETNHTEKK